MKKTIFFQFFVWVLLLVTSLSVIGRDVFSKEKGVRLKVELNTDKTFIKFSECKKTCQVIGTGWYSVNALKEQRTLEWLQFGGAVLSDLVLAYLAVEATAAGIAKTGLQFLNKEFVTVLLQRGVVSGTAVLANQFKPINPGAQALQAEMMNDRILADENFILNSDSDVKLVISTLKEVLPKLDQSCEICS